MFLLNNLIARNRLDPGREGPGDQCPSPILGAGPVWNFTGSGLEGTSPRARFSACWRRLRIFKARSVAGGALDCRSSSVRVTPEFPAKLNLSFISTTSSLAGGDLWRGRITGRSPRCFCAGGLTDLAALSSWSLWISSVDPHPQARQPPSNTNSVNVQRHTRVQRIPDLPDLRLPLKVAYLAAGCNQPG